MLVQTLRSRATRTVGVLVILCLLLVWLSTIYGFPFTPEPGLGSDPNPAVSSSKTNDEAAKPEPANNETPTSSPPRSRIGKVTVAANQLDSDTITRALKTHERHNVRHGYVHYIARNQVVGSLIENDRFGRPKGAWTKPAYLLAILVDELQKPEEERLEWLFWFDADTVLMNTETPLETFLPPKDGHSSLEDVDLLIASNWDGLNSGVFGLRVSAWSVSFMSAVLSYPIYQASRLETDRFRDQSAFQFLLGSGGSPLADIPMRGKEHWAVVPMRWFNSLPVNNAFFKNGSWIFGQEMSKEMFDKGTTEVFDDGWGSEVKEWKVMQGDLVVHFAGTSFVRDSWMVPWIERAEALYPEWNNATTKDVLKKEAAVFWKQVNEEMADMREKSAIEEKEKEKKKQEEKERKQKEEKEKEKQQTRERKQQEEVELKKNKTQVTVEARVSTTTAPKPTKVRFPASNSTYVTLFDSSTAS